MTKSIVRTIAVTVWTLAMLWFFQRTTQARLVETTTIGTRPASLMDPRLWEPAGDLLSTTFVGTNVDWLGGSAAVWTLPGDDGPRDLVESRGRRSPNHQQFTAKTKDRWQSFHLQLEFKFEVDDAAKSALEQFGNSGIYVYGLYEVQLLDTSRFLPPGPVPRELLHDGFLRVVVDGRAMEAPVNKILCGSIYGGDAARKDPLDGATTDRDGQLLNYCTPSGQWNRLDVLFLPPRFQGLRKTHDATVSVLINGRRVYYGRQAKYQIPRPTGAQQGKQDRAMGPIVIQDHGNKISFRAISIDPSWYPGGRWADLAGGVAAR